MLPGWAVDGFVASGAGSDVWRVHRIDHSERRPFAAKVFHLAAQNSPRVRHADLRASRIVERDDDQAELRHRVLREIIRERLHHDDK